MPAQARPLAPCSHTDGLIGYPSYECAALVRGNAGVTIVAIETALAETGFRVACPSAGALVATPNDIRVTADVTQWGSLRGSAVTAGSWRPVGSHPIPRGSVALRIAATRLSDSSTAFYRSLSAKGGHCDRVLPRPSPVRQCLVWWNGAVERPTREGLPSQTAGPETEVVAHNRVGRRRARTRSGTAAASSVSRLGSTAIGTGRQFDRSEAERRSARTRGLSQATNC
jgi:hypothetical protein